MRRFSAQFCLILFLIFSSSLFSQTQNKIGDFLKSKFENFEYEQVIASADSILNWNSNLTREDSIQIFYFKAISSFHLWDINQSEENFRLLIALDRNFELDSNEVSPKIISFFNQIKKKEDEIEIRKSQLNTENSSQVNPNLDRLQKNIVIYRESILKNLLLPGWGYIKTGEKTKGYLLASSFSLSIISSVFFSYLTSEREKEYLSEVIPERITEKYSSYNTAYKLRNISFLTLGLIYLYAQIDFLVNHPIFQFSAPSEINFNAKTNSINLKFKFPL